MEETMPDWSEFVQDVYNMGRRHGSEMIELMATHGVLVDLNGSVLERTGTVVPD